MPGHIRLGVPGALRDYMIANLDLYSRSPANQFAAKLATGAGDYDDLENWSYFVMDDWQAGVGQKDPEAGGFLYSELETRYPNEIRLPKALTFGDSYAPPLVSAASAITIGTTQSIKRVGRRIQNSSSGTVHSIVVKLLLPNVAISGGVTVALYSDSSGKPASQLTSTVITPVDGRGYSDYIATLTYAAVATTYYHVVVLPTTAGQTLTLPVFTASVPAAVFANYDGSSWATTTAAGFLHEAEWRNTGATTATKIVDFSFNDFLTIAAGTKLGFAVTSAFFNVTSFTYTSSITTLLTLGEIVLVGQGNVSNAYQIDDDFAETSLGVPANLFAQWNGYVWRAVANSLYYTADLVTWTGPLEITWQGWEVRGMAGLGDYLYVSTDDGLYYVGAGDQVLKVTNWASIEPTNGAVMINYHGALIISAGASLLRFDGNALLPIGLDKGEGLPANRAGTVAALVQQNNWLFAAINATDGQDSVWAYNDQGWHSIATIPSGLTIADMCYQRDVRQLRILCTNGVLLSVELPDVAREPSTASGWAVYGWLETDWFFGRLKEVSKDFESVYFSGENFSSNAYAVVYWQDDNSTDWELLGTVTSNRQELRWSDYDTRPNTRQLKLGLALYTKDASVTPIVRAVRVKYHPMVADWFRWSFSILVSDNQQELGGALSPYNAAQKRAHLDTLITQVPPFIFRDMDGTEYEVKVTGAQIQHTDVEWVGGQMQFDSIYNMSIEAIRNGTYQA